jgi:hypothetical protein
MTSPSTLMVNGIARQSNIGLVKKNFTELSLIIGTKKETILLGLDLFNVQFAMKS